MKYLRTLTTVKLVQLLDADDMGPDGKLTCAAPYDKPYNHVITGDAREFGDRIGPWKPFIASFAGAGARPITTWLVVDAHAAGLLALVLP